MATPQEARKYREGNRSRPDIRSGTALLSNPRQILVGVIIISIILREILVFHGGQLFFPDEWRFTRSWVLLRFLAEGAPGKAIDYLLRGPDHWGFTIISIPFAVAEAGYMKMRNIPLNSAGIPETAFFPMIGMMAFSVVSILLCYMIAHELGAAESESLIAAILMATTNTIFYYSRHLFPYDASMSFALLALWIGIRPGGYWRSFSCGLVAAGSFALYYGYWNMITAVLLIHIIYRNEGWRDVIRRGIVAGSAFILPLAGLTALSALRPVPIYPRAMFAFAQSVTQGDYNEGWLAPFLYLWESEHLVLVAWGVLIVVGLFTRGARKLLIPILGLVITYVTLGGASSLHTFVVYGRTSRQVVPFLCLAAAFGLGRLPRVVGYVVMALIVIQAADNFSAPIRQKYPMEVIRLAAPYSHATWTVFNSEAGYVDNLCHTVTPDLKPVYVLTNTTCFHFNVFPAEATLAGETIFSYTNPLSWPPFTFDQFNTAEKREKMEKFDFRMRLVKVR